jgi:catechol 2,3-dioxygenase-like lactoylglutathione lyase family enzyme
MTPSGTTGISILNSFLPHNDRDASVAFYQDVLGFEIRNDVGYNGMHWLTLGPPGQGDTNIVLYPLIATPDLTDDERGTIQAMMEKGTFGRITLAASDVDGEFARIKAAGAIVAQEPTDQQWGGRDCAFKDPSGNEVRITQAG